MPDLLFHSFRTSISGDQMILCGSGRSFFRPQIRWCKTMKKELHNLCGGKLFNNGTKKEKKGRVKHANERPSVVPSCVRSIIRAKEKFAHRLAMSKLIDVENPQKA